jgi:hypothetical protein
LGNPSLSKTSAERRGASVSAGPLEVEIFLREKQTQEALAALQKSDAEKWWPIIKELRIRAE